MQTVPFDIDALAGERRPIVRLDPTDGVPELVELAWGLEPSQDQKPFRFIRSEGRAFPSHRCLIPASEFHMKTPRGRFRTRLASGDWFYLAGLWQPTTGTWPEAFAIVTIEANADIASYQDRQGGLIVRGQHMQWLEAGDAEMLRPPPPATFIIEPLASPKRRQPGFSF